MNSQNAPNDFLLFDIIQVRLALKLDEHRRQDVLRTVEEMTAGGDVSDIEALVRTLSRQPTSHKLWQRLIRVATIGETYFFRDRNQLNALQFTILRDLIEERRRLGRYQLRLWSAGCSTGEEPYSLAMMVRDMLPDYSVWDVHILATDLNVSNLERAHAGIYRSWSFRAETPSDVRQRWFTSEPNGDFRIERSIREMVTFAPLNLASADYPSVTSATIEMDVILCRNVLIYFDTFSASSVISRFHDALSQKGWLILGHSESAHIVNRGFEPRNFENAVLYQKNVQPSELERTTSNIVQLPLPAPQLAKTGHLPPLPAGSVPKKTTGSLLSPTQLRFPASKATASKTAPLPSLSTNAPSKRNTAPLTSTGPLCFPTSALRPAKTAPLPSLSANAPSKRDTAPLTPPRLADPFEQARRAADSEQWQEALRWLAEAEKDDTFCPKVHYLRGVVKLQQKETEQGVASLRQAIYCDPSFVMAHVALGDVYERHGQYKKASYEWNQAREILACLRPVEVVPCGDDMTVEMLSGLIRFRIANLTVKR